MRTRRDSSARTGVAEGVEGGCVGGGVDDGLDGGVVSGEESGEGAVAEGEICRKDLAWRRELDLLVIDDVQRAAFRRTSVRRFQAVSMGFSLVGSPPRIMTGLAVVVSRCEAVRPRWPDRAWAKAT